MTLILAAISKDGLCVCADKIIMHSNGVSENNFNKIYIFSEIPLIVYNHGVNHFNNRYWDIYCSEYEKSNKWKYLNFHDICENFKKYIEIEIENELKKNFYNKLEKEYTKTGFVFCGKGKSNNLFKIYELFWSYELDGLKLERNKSDSFICSGNGKLFLKNYFDNNKKIFSKKYWEKLDIEHTKKELINIFEIAVNEQNNLNLKKIFSNEYQTKCIFDV